MRLDQLLARSQIAALVVAPQQFAIPFLPPHHAVLFHPLDRLSELDPLETIGSEEHQYEVSEDRAVLAPGFRVLDERERTILHLRFFEGLTQSQIAQQIGISQMHVSRLIRRSLEKIRAEIAVGEDEQKQAARAAEQS